MNKFKKLTSLCIVFAGILGICFAEGKANSASAINYDGNITTEKTVTFNSASSKTIHVSVDNITFAALELELHYDETYFNHVSNIYNDHIFDGNKHEYFTYNISNPGVLKATYLFDNDRTFKDTDLFYFNLSPKSVSADIDSYLDVIVGNVVDANGDKLNIASKGSYLNIRKPVENIITKHSDHGTNLNKNEFYKDQILEYTLAKYDGDSYSSSQLIITYDRDLLEFQDIKYEYCLKNALKNINANTKGVIFISFINDVDIANYHYLLRINFKVIKSVNVESQIETKFDILANSANEKVYAEAEVATYKVLETPIIPITPSFYLNNIETPSLANFEISLYMDENINLGAADLNINFDKTVIKYVSNKTETVSGFDQISVNDKKANEGLLRVSLLSINGVKTANKLATFTFISVNDSILDTNLTMTGKDICDPQLNDVQVDLIGSKISLTKHVHGHGKWKVIKEPTYIEEGLQESNCPICGEVVTSVIPRLLNDTEYNEILKFATNFMNANICGTNDNTKASSELFLKQTDDFDLLSAKVKEALRNTKANSTSENIVELALARYDRIILLHNKENKLAYPDFMNRMNNNEVLEHPNLADDVTINFIDGNLIYVIAFCISAVSLISLSAFYVKSRKRSV